MDINDIYYRALSEYRKVTAKERRLEKRRKAIAAAGGDRIEIVTVNCIIEEDWIEAIEKGLVHVEKAINEERQFIRSNGEVVPIEKVKNVSKDSVEHLAKHSNLLTKETEGEDIIPDSLYTVERLADYAVYENRFLYMLLCFLRDFIAFRYDRIVELTNTYNGKLHVKKTVNADGVKTEYEVSLNEEIKNDEYLKEHNPAKKQIERIDLIYKTTLAFLKTPLMESVAKAPVLKPPITETNVLRMNKNFRGAKELYYFISSYTKAGYTAERVEKVITPFSAAVADVFAESAALDGFLTYMYGLGIESELKQAYEREILREKEREQREKEQKLEQLKSRLAQTGKGAEEYIFELERRVRALEDDAAQLVAAQDEIQRLNGENSEFRLKIGELNEKEREHGAQIEKLNAEHSERERQARESFRADAERLKSECKQKIAEVCDECEKLIKSAGAEAEKKSRAYEEIKRRLAAEDNQRALAEARLNAMRRQYNLIAADEDYSDKTSFDEIEKQYEAFKKFFNEEWKSAKKRIRKEVLTRENIKAKSKEQVKNKKGGRKIKK